MWIPLWNGTEMSGLYPNIRQRKSKEGYAIQGHFNKTHTFLSISIV